MKNHPTSFGPRAFSGFLPYRHGEDLSNADGTVRQVYVPGKSGRSVLAKQRLDHLVERTSDILAQWHSSPFEHEGACRHGLRSALCEEGLRWPRADLEAANLVERALNRNRARRPTWDEGQPGYTQSPDYCAWCQGPMDDTDGMPATTRYCSVDCAKSALQHGARKNSYYYGAALSHAYKEIARHKAAPRPCEQCGKLFKSERSDKRFCSLKCFGLNKMRDAKPCANCGTSFHALHANILCCSRKCNIAYQKTLNAERFKNEPRPCKCCGKDFLPTWKTQAYCTPACQQLNSKLLFDQRKRAKAAAARTRSCDFCGTVYQPKNSRGIYCSKRCSHLGIRLGHGIMPAWISAPVFDHFFTLPINGRPPWLTAERFDELLAA